MIKKILFISPLPPPHYGSAMSSEMCLEVLRSSKKFKVENIKLNYSREFNDVGKINFSKLKGYFSVKKEIDKKLKDFDPEIVYFMPALSRIGLFRDYLFIKDIKKIFHKKLVFHVRERILEKDWKKFNRVYKSMFKDSSVIVLDDCLKKDLHGIIPDKNLYILPNAIANEVSEKEIKLFAASRKKRNIPTVLFLSNMDITKGWFKLLQACKILQTKKQNFNCIFVGEWPSEKERKIFYDYIEENNLTNVKYLGKKTGKEKNKTFAESDLLVFPTEYPPETFGRVNIEAMMFGLPVISNSIAAIPSIILDKKTGFLLKENTPKEIAEKIEILLNDKRSREKMGMAGRRRFLEKFELENYEKKFIDLLYKKIS